MSEPAAVVIVLDRAFGESVNFGVATCNGVGAWIGADSLEMVKCLFSNKIYTFDGTEGIHSFRKYYYLSQTHSCAISNAKNQNQTVILFLQFRRVFITVIRNKRLG